MRDLDGNYTEISIGDLIIYERENNGMASIRVSRSGVPVYGDDGSDKFLLKGDSVEDFINQLLFMQFMGLIRGFELLSLQQERYFVAKVTK